jgi:hypothetical protein
MPYNISNYLVTFCSQGASGRLISHLEKFVEYAPGQTLSTHSSRWYLNGCNIFGTYKQRKQVRRPEMAAMSPSLPPGHLPCTSTLPEGVRWQIFRNAYCSIGISYFINHVVHLLVPIECFRDADVSPSTFSSSSWVWKQEKQGSIKIYTSEVSMTHDLMRSPRIIWSETWKLKSWGRRIYWSSLIYLGLIQARSQEILSGSEFKLCFLYFSFV